MNEETIAALKRLRDDLAGKLAKLDDRIAELEALEPPKSKAGFGDQVSYGVVRHHPDGTSETVKRRVVGQDRDVSDN